MSESTFDALGPAVDWIGSGQPVAIATVTRTWGSAPRPTGSQMAVRGDGAFAGSVSGGCVEGAVISEAQAALKDGKTRNLSFGVSNEEAWSVGLACGGTIEIHVAPATASGLREALAQTDRARRENRPVVLASDLRGDKTRVLFPDEGGDEGLVRLEAADERSHRFVKARCSAGAVLEATEDEELLLEVMDRGRTLQARQELAPRGSIFIEGKRLGHLRLGLVQEGRELRQVDAVLAVVVFWVAADPVCATVGPWFFGHYARSVRITGLAS